MEKRIVGSRGFWLMVGVIGGLCTAYFWPHEPAFAVATDRSNKFALCTAPAGSQMEGVFLLDFLTGNLQGHVLNTRNGQFTRSYFRNIAADFDLDPKTEPQWAIVSGLGQLAATRGTSWATSLIYVTELTSGKVVVYGFPYTETQQLQEPTTLEKINMFAWRESVTP